MNVLVSHMVETTCISLLASVILWNYSPFVPVNYVNWRIPVLFKLTHAVEHPSLILSVIGGN
jgi:hypothetical protein